jgi:hypothetical protein
MKPVDCGKRVFIPLYPRISGPGPDYLGNPDIPGKTEDSAPPESSEQICKEFDFG